LPIDKNGEGLLLLLGFFGLVPPLFLSLKTFWFYYVKRLVVQQRPDKKSSQSETFFYLLSFQTPWYPAVGGPKQMLVAYSQDRPYRYKPKVHFHLFRLHPKGETVSYFSQIHPVF
jgi:hypothetical protein